MRATITLDKGDGWGVGVMFYPSEWAITFNFLCWYLCIEKAYQ